MSDVKDYYKILGVEKNATEDEIKKAYRKKAAKLHPDKFANASEEERKKAEDDFKELNEANSVLSDAEKRNNYDQFGDPNGGGFDPFSGHGSWDPFGNMDSFFGRGQRQQVNKGDDAQVIVELTLEEAFNGCEKEITFNKHVSCAHCNGTGSEDGKTHNCSHCNGTGRIVEHKQFGPGQFMQNITTCPYCKGTGKETTTKCSHCHGTGFENQLVREKINIPAGMEDGLSFVREGMGHEPQGKGVNGDLYITIKIKSHQVFERRGNDLLANVYVNLQEAWCGDEKEFKCIDGTTIKVKIPELSEDGKILRVQGKGMRPLRGFGMGDLYLKIKYITPKHLSSKQKDLLKQFYKN